MADLPFADRDGSNASNPEVDCTARLPRNVKKVRKACLQAAKDYMPRPYPGRVILFRSSHKPLGQVSDPHAGWSTYATGLEIYEVKSNHENILLEPQVRFVAEQLRTCLDEELTRRVGQLADV